MRKLYEIFKVLKIQKKSSFRGNYLWKYGKPELFIGLPADSSSHSMSPVENTPKRKFGQLLFGRHTRLNRSDFEQYFLLH
jgi:hypothetical protein